MKQLYIIGMPGFHLETLLEMKDEVWQMHNMYTLKLCAWVSLDL